MIRMEPEAPGRAARVVGSLCGDAVQVLVEAVESGVSVLDLSGVDQVDDAAVRVLVDLWPERCSLIACPRWLELWIETARRRREA
jgi:ABC-type transporter Mla MlaB component